MKNKGFILLALSIIVLTVVNIYMVRDMASDLNNVSYRLDSIDTSVRRAENIARGTSVIQNTACRTRSIPQYRHE